MCWATRNLPTKKKASPMKPTAQPKRNEHPNCADSSKYLKGKVCLLILWGQHYPHMKGRQKHYKETENTEYWILNIELNIQYWILIEYWIMNIGAETLDQILAFWSQQHQDYTPSPKGSYSWNAQMVHDTQKPTWCPLTKCRTKTTSPDMEKATDKTHHLLITLNTEAGKRKSR